MVEPSSLIYCFNTGTNVFATYLHSQLYQIAKLSGVSGRTPNITKGLTLLGNSTV